MGVSTLSWDVPLNYPRVTQKDVEKPGNPENDLLSWGLFYIDVSLQEGKWD
jgi:hypothetical protein